MSIGANGGGQLNIIVMEVGIVTTEPTTGAEVVTTVSVHPLLVAPRSIRYSDASRSPVMETTGGSILTRAGRALRTVQMDGMFGVESRGLGPYIGSGEMRFQRFYKEVVRMSDALSDDDVQAAVDILNGTPFISLLVKPFVEGYSTFYINVYDFWNDVAFQALVPSFGWTREFRNGGATGNISYQLVVKEVGPLKEGGLGNEIISALLAVLGTWDDINDVLGAYTATEIIDAQIAVAAIVASELADTVEAVNAQVQSVQELMGGNTAASLASDASNDGIASFFSNCQRLVEQGEEAVTALNQALGLGEFDNDSGAISPTSVDGEGSNRALDMAGRIADLEGVIDAGRFYQAAGKFFGMGRSDYQAFILGGGALGLFGPDAAGSERHPVALTDTPASIERRYGVTWARILELNNLTPDEALFPGTVLQIPVPRPKGPQGIRGLPTFDSHVGKSAWGIDLPLELTARNGDVVTVDEEDVLVQGATFLVEQVSDDLLNAVKSVPDAVKTRYLSRRLSALFLLDGRFTSTEDVTVAITPDGGFDVEATLHAINGGTITTGGAT